MTSRRPLLRSQQVDVEDSPDAVFEHVTSRGWGDGLPVIPPTEERVWRMVEGTGLPEDHRSGSPESFRWRGHS